MSNTKINALSSRTRSYPISLSFSESNFHYGMELRPKSNEKWKGTKSVIQSNIEYSRNLENSWLFSNSYRHAAFFLLQHFNTRFQKRGEYRIALIEEREQMNWEGNLCLRKENNGEVSNEWKITETWVSLGKTSHRRLSEAAEEIERKARRLAGECLSSGSP